MVILSLGCTACSRSGLPSPESKQYREFVSAFYVGLAGLQTGEDVQAKGKFTLASQLAPGEPATWANLALFSVRQQDFDAGFSYAEKARSLAPDNSRIEALVGIIESKRGKLPESISHLRKAVELDGKNLKATYALAERIESQATPASDAETQKLFQSILAGHPGNIAVQLDLIRMAAKRGDGASVKSEVDRIASESAAWPEEARRRLASLYQTAQSADPRAASVQVAFLRNVLARVPAYRQSVNDVKTPAVFVGEPFLRFLKLPTPDSEPAATDASLRFNAQPLTNMPVYWAGAMPLDDSGKSFVITVDGKGVQIAGGGRLAAPGNPPGAIGRYGVLGADLNYDFKTDLVIAGAGGVRLYRQQDPGHFVDLTPRSRIPTNLLGGNYSGAWAFDVDLDGDLDVILGSVGGEPLVLRNNADGTFAVIRPFKEVKGLISFAAADIDGDGDPDVAMVDADGSLHVFSNERLGEFHPRPLPPSVKGHFLAVAAGDINGDGMPDFVALRDDGSVIRLSDRDSGTGWDVIQIVKPGNSPLNAASANLLLADFDNNGSLDILAGGKLFLGDGRGFMQSSAAIPSAVSITSAADLNNDGRVDLIGFAGNAVALVNHGAKNYNWQALRVRAARSTGDQRINSFGIGGEVEIRSGLLTQKQIITSPLLHFGLGERTQTDVARIVWPNGSIQAEFELMPNQTLLAEQRLKGSCPFLFAWNGKEINFVKDGEPWSPALGLHINAQVVAGIYQTQEWFKIPGESLVPRNGYYDLRVTAELWETYYIDHYSLLAVDHPAGTEIFTDERFAVPPPPLKIFTVSEPRPFQAARDDNGNDVSDVVRSIDRNYLDTFGRGRYQGVTRDHWVEVELPDSAPRGEPLFLIGYGWMHPTDATVNIALSQNSDAAPQGLSIEVPDAKGHWVTAKRGLGFLAGRLKTAVLDISDVFRPGAPRKLRLRTNMEIYWDRLAWARGLPDSNTDVRRSPLAKADLHYRGFSTISAANPSSPEIPDYNRLEGAAQKWRDLEGYCTRYGDVRELLDKIDDRMVITNAGDELLLQFAALRAPASGMKRDYVMVGDGWIKDGDYNSVFSKTVLPLPYHGMKNYTRRPSTLEDDPAYKLHPQDWQQYHTRYITPLYFTKALWN